MIRNVIQGSDGAVILIDIGDKLGNKGALVFAFLLQLLRPGGRFG